MRNNDTAYEVDVNAMGKVYFHGYCVVGSANPHCTDGTVGKFIRS